VIDVKYVLKLEWKEEQPRPQVARLEASSAPEATGITLIVAMSLLCEEKDVRR
jgi:hypothetical protein